jgi:hypothetical protein
MVLVMMRPFGTDQRPTLDTGLPPTGQVRLLASPGRTLSATVHIIADGRRYAGETHRRIGKEVA